MLPPIRPSPIMASCMRVAPVEGWMILFIALCPRRAGSVSDRSKQPPASGRLRSRLAILGLTRPAHLLARRGRHLLRREAELLLQLLERRRRPERLHAEARPRRADVLRPAERRGLLHRHPRRHLRRQHLLAILGVLG